MRRLSSPRVNAPTFFHRLPVMNNIISYAQKSIANVVALHKIKDSGSHLAAGLQITVAVGADAPSDRIIKLEVGLSTDIDKLLDAIITAAQDSEEFWIKRLREDVDKAQKVLDGKL